MEFLFLPPSPPIFPSHLAFSFLPLHRLSIPVRLADIRTPSSPHSSRHNHSTCETILTKGKFVLESRPAIRRGKLEFRRCKLVGRGRPRRDATSFWHMREEGERRERLNGIFIVWKKERRKGKKRSGRIDRRETMMARGNVPYRRCEHRVSEIGSMFALFSGGTIGYICTRIARG